MTTQKILPCEFVAGLCSNCGASERGECEGWVEPADRVQTLADQVEALTKERDTLQYEVDAIPAIKAERDTQAKAADHWMTEATRDHNALVTLRVERDALMAAAKLALDAMAPMRGMILFDEAIKALREAGVK